MLGLRATQSTLYRMGLFDLAEQCEWAADEITRLTAVLAKRDGHIELLQDSDRKAGNDIRRLESVVAERDKRIAELERLCEATLFCNDNEGCYALPSKLVDKMRDALRRKAGG